MLRVLVLAVFLASLMPPAAAAEEKPGAEGPYLILGATAGKPNDPRASPEYTADLGMELGGQLGLGYAYKAIRFEAQVGYEAFFLNNLKPANGSVLSNVDAYGKVSGPVAMANLFFRPGDDYSLNPFLGAGIGVAMLNTKFEGDFCSVPSGTCYTNERIAGGRETVGAWQLAIGMSRMSRDGHSELFIGYRYFATQDFSTNLTGYGTITQEGLESHSLTLGMRWYFGGNGK